MFYSLNINQMQRLYDSTDPLVRRISEILQLLLMNNFDVAKYNWLTKVCQLLPNSMNVLDVFGTDKNMVMEPIKEVFRRGYEFSTCSSEMCPLNTIEVKEDHVCDMTLHSPDKIENDTQLIKSSIKEWELGSSSKAVISCKGRFDDEPDHGDFFAEDINGKSIIRCSGWRTPLNMKFDTKPPFLIFDISAVFRDDLKNLSCIPYDIFVYDDHYRLGGVSSFLSNRNHYVGYICLKSNQILYYDGLPSFKPQLRVNSVNNIQGDVSLLFYFPFDDVDESIDIDISTEHPAPGTSKINELGQIQKKASCENIRRKNSTKNTRKRIGIKKDPVPVNNKINKLDKTQKEKIKKHCKNITRKRSGLRKNPAKKCFHNNG